MTDAPAFDFYPERWLVGVAGLSDAEQLAYLRLLCHQWLMDGLPADAVALKRLAGRGVTEAVLDKLPVGDDGKRRNRRLETIREDQRKRISKSRDKIARMNSARASKKHPQEPLQEPLVEGLQDPSCRASCRAPHHSPLTTHPNHLLQNSLCEPERKEAERHGARRDGEGMEDLANPGIPPVTLEQAKANAGQYGASPEIAEKWWLEQDARGWLDGRGQAIARPWSSLRSFAIGWQGREARDAARSPAAARQSDIQRRREERHGSEKLEIEYT